MKVVFFGTPFFARQVLEHILNENIEIVAIVTKPDQPQGRSLKMTPSPVKLYCMEHNLNIPLYQPDKASTPEFINLISEFRPDFFVVVGYGEILRQQLLDIPKIAPINIHTSLLPAYRGAAPIQRAMMAGESVMGITIMKMDAKMDSGDLLLQKTTDVDYSDTFEVVQEKLISLSRGAIVDVLKNFEHYQSNSTKQDLNKVTHAPKIEVDDCKIEPYDSAFLAQRKIMALSPKPAAWVYGYLGQNQKRFKIIEAVPSSKKFSGQNFILEDQKIYLSMPDGAIEIIKIQAEGKNICSAKEFLNGHKIFFPIPYS